MANPSGCRMLVRVDEVEETTAGGIVLPSNIRAEDTAASGVGTVVRQGKHCYKGKLAENCGSDEKWCEVGDIIYFKQYHGTRLARKKNLDRTYYYMWINDNDMLGLWEEGDDEL